MRGANLAVSGKQGQSRLVSGAGIGLGLVLALNCGGDPAPQGGVQGGVDDTQVEVKSALTAQDILGFESLAAWTASSGTASLTTTHTQGAVALALRAPVNYTPIVSAPIASSAAGLAGLSAAGSVLNVDVLLPVQQPNPFYFGALQLFVSVPSRSVFNQYLGQVELTGRPLGAFQTLAFAPTDAVRNSLRGATFSDLTFTLALNAPFGATGTYIFDNLRVAGVVVPVPDFAISASPTSLQVQEGASVATSVTVASSGGFAGTVTLSAGPLPAGVTATFTPPTVVGGGSSTLTFAAAASAPPVGPTAITVTGTSGSITHSTTVTLAVAGDFTIAESPSSLSVIQGNSVTASIAIFPVGGFGGTVTLSATGLPGGVTAAFGPPTIVGSGSSTLTLAASLTAAVTPAATITVTGRSGSVVHSVTFVLTVLPPAPVQNFTIAETPSTVSLVVGGSADVSVAIFAEGGFAGVVDLVATGLPNGVSATFSPPSVVGGGFVTLTLAAAATADLTPASTITVTGSSGSLSHSVTFVLSVVAAP